MSGLLVILRLIYLFTCIHYLFSYSLYLVLLSLFHLSLLHFIYLYLPVSSIYLVTTHLCLFTFLIYYSRPLVTLPLTFTCLFYVSYICFIYLSLPVHLSRYQSLSPAYFIWINQSCLAISFARFSYLLSDFYFLLSLLSCRIYFLCRSSVPLHYISAIYRFSLPKFSRQFCFLQFLLISVQYFFPA